MKTHIKMGVAVFLLSILSVAGIKSPKIKAEMIDSSQKLYEITDVEIDGHTYQAIMYSIDESNGKGKKEIRLLGLHTEEDTIYIPESIDGMPVTSVGGGTYFACENTKNFTEAKTKEKRYLLWSADPNKEYKEVVLPSTLEAVGSRCFSAVKINKVVVPKKVIYMGGGTGLKEVVIQGQDTTIGIQAFEKGRLQKITFPKKYHGKLEYRAFSQSQIESFVWPDHSSLNGWRKVDTSLFDGCKKLKKVTFPKYLDYVYIPSGCFSDCKKLKQLTFPKNIDKVVYKYMGISDNQPYGPRKLVFKGKNTRLRGLKAAEFLNSNRVGKKYKIDLKKKDLLTTIKVVAPKKSKAIQYAKKAYRIQKIYKNSSVDKDLWKDLWHEYGKKGYKLAKVKWSYLK